MTDENDAAAGRYLPPGTRVRRDAHFNQDEFTTPEYGAIVHCWYDERMRAYDCYIAFFGEVGFPQGQPDGKPYILRYYAVGLTVCDS